MQRRSVKHRAHSTSMSDRSISSAAPAPVSGVSGVFPVPVFVAPEAEGWLAGGAPYRGSPCTIVAVRAWETSELFGPAPNLIGNDAGRLVWVVGKPLRIPPTRTHTHCTEPLVRRRPSGMAYAPEKKRISAICMTQP